MALKPFSEFNKTASEELNEFAPTSDDTIPNLFATIHHKSDTRPDGMEDHEISAFNVMANKHMPELYEALKRDHMEAFPDHPIDNDEPQPKQDIGE
jgi:hypothetical protein